MKYRKELIVFVVVLIAACGDTAREAASNDASDGSGGVRDAGGLADATDTSNCTHIVPVGTYVTPIDSESFPSNAQVCAEEDGQVTYTGPFAPSGYNMRGFVVNSDASKDIGDGVFERMSFVGGPACGNATNTSASSNTIIRDSAFYGTGGRYLFMAWQVTDVQITNAIFRVDGGWGETQECNEYEPNAALNFYDSSEASCDGCVNIDQRSTAQGDSEGLGGLGVNAHSADLCFSVEFSNSIDFNSVDGSFWADGNGICDPRFTNIEGDVNLNLDGTAIITNATGGVCNSWSGEVVSTDSNMASGNCASQGAGADISLDTAFLDDPRWRSEMCGQLSDRTDGWCATKLSLSEYISQ